MFFSAINLFLLIAFIVNIFNSKEELAVSIISIIILLIPLLILILIYKKIKIKIANDNLLLENLRKQNKLEEEQQEINKTNQLIIEEQAKINEIIKKTENDKAT